MSKNRFLSSSVLASRAIRKNSSAMWRCSSAVASRIARACRRTPALIARLAMWKAGDYLLPPPTLRLRARLESGGIGRAASRAAAVRTFHQL